MPIVAGEKTMIQRPILIASLSVFLLGWIPGDVRAHHSPMLYDESKLIVLEGFVSNEMTGYPHWEIRVRANGEDWKVETGYKYILERAGLSGEGREFTIGRKITVMGYLPVNPDVRRLHTTRIILDGKSYDLFGPQEN
jgi:hypothetical protein